MPVYKLSMKIIKKNIPVMLIYIIVFLGITVIFASQGTQQAEATFKSTKINVAFYSEETTPLVEGFKNELSRYANYIDIEDSKEALQDALFFRDVQYILRVPAGFTDSVMSGEPIELIKTTVPASMAAAYLDVTIEQYFSLAKMYMTGMPNMTQKELVSEVSKTMEKNLTVEFLQAEAPKSQNFFALYYFNYLAYSLFAVIVLGISNVMVVVNKQEIKQRNICAPMSNFRVNMEFLLGHLTFTMASWVIMIGFFFIFNGLDVEMPKLLYFMLNSFVFTLCAASISFFIGSLLKNQNAISAISNVVTLGPCFISGIFVPQELLGETVLKIASFTPTYWFAKGNGLIAHISNFKSVDLAPVFDTMLIQLGFGLAFLAVAMVVNKKKQVTA